MQQTEPRQESPLVGVQGLLANAAPDLFDQVRIQEKPFLELNNIRGNSSEPAFVQAVKAVIGADLPVVPNTVAQGPDYTLWWLSPDEWLAQAKAPAPARLVDDLRAHFEGLFATTVDVTSGYTTLTLSGKHADAVINKGCPLDLHSRVFGPGRCAQSLFFKAAVALRREPDGTLNMIVRRSFADYVARMLADASEEFLP